MAFFHAVDPYRLVPAGVATGQRQRAARGVQAVGKEGQQGLVGLAVNGRGLKPDPEPVTVQTSKFRSGCPRGYMTVDMPARRGMAQPAHGSPW